MKSNQNEIIREVGRIVVGGYYDYQEIRKANANRIRDILRRRKEGIPTVKPEAPKEDVEKSYGEEYEDDKIPALLQGLKDEDKLTTAEADYVVKALDAKGKADAMETAYKSLMDEYVKTEPAFEWLGQIRGISTVLGANLVKSFGYCERYEHVSSLWRHCGLHVVDGHAPKRTKGQVLDFNPKHRTLAWKIGDSFIKKRTIPYRGIYDAEKARQASLLEAKAPNAPVRKLHADLRARRKMVKVFLSHYWHVTRRMTGQAVTRPYAMDRLGHNSYIPPPCWDDETKEVVEAQ